MSSSEGSQRKGGPVRMLLRVVVFALLFVALAEVWLRMVTPASETPNQFQDARSKISRYDPGGPRVGRFTTGRLARGRTLWRVNNAGWISAVDYLPPGERKGPLVALYGDSYIEGFPTNVDQHVDVYLSRLLHPSADVYAFGESGWYLEQYVAASRYTASLYQPDVLVILIGEGDVTDSLRENGVRSPNYWQISRDESGFREIPPPVIYRQSARMRLAKRSAIVRYLRYNALLNLPGMPNAAIPQPSAAPSRARDGGQGADPNAGNAWRELLPAADYLVRRLCAEHLGTPIVFAYEGDRYLAPQTVADTPIFADAAAIREACKRRPQCHVLDLRPAFSRDWAEHRYRFEAADGGHWNAYANRLVARTLADFIDSHGLVEGKLQNP